MGSDGVDAGRAEGCRRLRQRGVRCPSAIGEGVAVARRAAVRRRKEVNKNGRAGSLESWPKLLGGGWGSGLGYFRGGAQHRAARVSGWGLR